MPEIEWGDLFARRLNKKERVSATSRLARLHEEGPLWRSITHTRETLAEVGGKPNRLVDNGFHVRQAFVFKDVDHATVDASDRRAPPRADRPPLTRITSGNGATLRLELAALALGQMRYQRGSRRPPLDFPVWGHSGIRSWSDMIATPAAGVRHTREYYSPKDKRARSVGGSLKALRSAGLVSVDQVGKEKLVTFLNESGKLGGEGPVPYEVPLAAEPTVKMPGEFITNGWIHVLEDSEISVLFMAACHRGGFADGGWGYAIPGAVRLLNYGIGRESYSTALKTLEWFGLLAVHEVGRHEDGRAVDFGTEEPQLHRISLIPAGFLEDGPTHVVEVLRKQLARSPA